MLTSPSVVQNLHERLVRNNHPAYCVKSRLEGTEVWAGDYT